ncbi:PLC-like phosphodiesterase [Emericellopsis atlantica]|uniref:Phosphoinositide phospholipase C n=1 Tax=Emericellopsis atlantica TaxID=2614577 RepID=A0A9P7ZDG4_9HYPO|nr:PLC-like phosphodiesterase [Emericellopsis atlantica]KAG9249545.1 PLC-like phosphodiesterase [Emericellopsis atlantica]
MADITAKLSSLNPFREKGKEDDEDRGESVDVDSTGHRIKDKVVTKDKLHVSSALRSFIIANGILSEKEAGTESDASTDALRALVTKPHINFISSSHNTYLVAHQLYGTSCVSAYETAIKTGSRCVEIDAWDNSDNMDEPKVTHGFTLVSNIPFRSVCEAIRDCCDEEEEAAAGQDPHQRQAPILLSLENHCDAHGQLRLAQIMREVFGHRLLSEPVRMEGHREQADSGEHVTLEELGAKIVVMVEYHLPDEADDSDSDSDDSEDDEQEKAARKEYKDKKKKAPSTTIVPELAELGVYAQSVKPGNNSWFSDAGLTNGPHHHLINVSESGLASHLPEQSASIARHNAKHLMRVFPKGTRISSSNLKPVPFWGIGAQVCALNWQTFGTSNQLNDALFAGSDGFVLKPAALRAGGDGKLSTGRKRKLRPHVGGASDIQLPEETEVESFKPYLTCTLFHPDDLKNEPPKRKTAPYKQHKLGFLHRGENPPPTDPIWDDVLEWEYDDSDLVFLRLLIKHDESWAKNPNIAVHAVRLSYVVPGWSFIRMLDLKGRETRTSLLVRFEFEDV